MKKKKIDFHDISTTLGPCLVERHFTQCFNVFFSKQISKHFWTILMLCCNRFRTWTKSYFRFYLSLSRFFNMIYLFLFQLFEIYSSWKVCGPDHVPNSDSMGSSWGTTGFVAKRPRFVVILNVRDAAWFFTKLNELIPNLSNLKVLHRFPYFDFFACQECLGFSLWSCTFSDKGIIYDYLKVVSDNHANRSLSNFLIS